jgi:nitrogen-specific signal transduction histidine kinase
MDELQAELINLHAKNADLTAQVRDLQQAEAAAEAANEAKTRFLAMVSHEIRTPLSGIIGLADLLGLGQLDQEQRAYVEAIRGAGAALVSLLGEILDLSRVEAGRLDLEDAPYDIVALVEGAAELLAPRAQGKNLEIASYIGPEVPRILMGDGARIRQIVLNLAGNAAKFTKAGGIGLSVRVIEGNLLIEVADTGPGVPEDRRAAIFEDFEQADSGSARSHEGAGLGLAISLRLAQRLGGSLTLARSGAKGSVFAFTCPLRPAHDQPSAPERLCSQSVLLVGASTFELPFIAQRLRELAFLNSGLEIVFTDERPAGGRSETFFYKNGVEEFVRQLNTNKAVLHPKVIAFKKETQLENDGKKIEIHAELGAVCVGESLPLPADGISGDIVGVVRKNLHPAPGKLVQKCRSPVEIFRRSEQLREHDQNYEISNIDATCHGSQIPFLRPAFQLFKLNLMPLNPLSLRL